MIFPLIISSRSFTGIAEGNNKPHRPMVLNDRSGGEGHRKKVAIFTLKTTVTPSANIVIDQRAINLVSAIRIEPFSKIERTPNEFAGFSNQLLHATISKHGNRS